MSVELVQGTISVMTVHANIINKRKCFSETFDLCKLFEFVFNKLGYFSSATYNLCGLVEALCHKPLGRRIDSRMDY
jgi:hypothetical protein